MLILSRKVGEEILIEDVVVTVKAIDGKRVKLAIEAHSCVKILRGELRPVAKINVADGDVEVAE